MNRAAKLRIMTTHVPAERPHRISAGAIIRDGAKLLLVHHLNPGRYDFWVCPGGGVKADESLEDAARREVREETGLDVAIGKLVYIEELANPELRMVKFWFLGEPIGGALDVAHPEARNEHITEARWVDLASLAGTLVFPEFLAQRFASDQAAGFPRIVRMPLRQMAVW
jgi:8-oxo-dGTP diphosphatase